MNPHLRPGEHWDPYTRAWTRNLTEAEVQKLWPYNTNTEEAPVAEFVSPDLEDTLRQAGLFHPLEDTFASPKAPQYTQADCLTDVPTKTTRRYLTSKDLAANRAPTAELQVVGEMVNNMLEMADMVTLPQHYARFKIEPIRFICENNLNFFQGNIVKYILRHDAKNGLEDLKKARRYLDMFIKFVEGDVDWWRKEA